MQPKQTIEAFDCFLAEKEERFSAVIIGAGALSLLGVISRETRDIDVLDPPLPQERRTWAMSFRRSFLPEAFAAGEELTSCLIGIGMRLHGTARRNANIEDTLIAAALEGLSQDGRVLSLLVDWFDLHHQRVNADRLVRMILQLASDQEQNFSVVWAAMGEWKMSDGRFSKLKRLVPKQRFDFLEARTNFLIEKNGEDPRFASTCLRVPNKVFRHRPEDVLTPRELARIHPAYRFRILMGPSYRADMWALLSQRPNIGAAELARRCYGSYPTAFTVKRDFALINRRLSVLQPI